MLCYSIAMVNNHTFRQHPHHPSISDASERNPANQLAAGIMFIDISQKQLERGGKSVVIDCSIITPAAESYTIH